MKTFVIGDIHGCYKTMTALLEKIEYSENDKLIFLGDYIDRGNNSYEVLKYLIDLKEKNKNVILLMGNHEDMMLKDEYSWILNGAETTKNSFNKNNASIDCFNDIIKEFPLYYEDDNFIYVHAGVPHSTIKASLNHDLIWDRSHIYMPKKKNAKKVIFGHTPKPEVYTTINGDIGIDTQCVYGGKLTCLVIENGKILYNIQQYNIE